MLFEDRPSRSKLGMYCDIVSRMKPGECLDVDVRELYDIATHWHNDSHFTAADRILGNIMGSAYTHSFDAHQGGQKITFMRHENTGERRYREPDHDIRIERLRSGKR